MTDKERKYLSDMLSSINYIFSFTKEINTFEQYKNDHQLKAAVERHLGIIGEAVNKFLKESANNNLISAIQIINLRNRLIHAYDKIDDRIIWSIIKSHLNPLKQEIEQKII